MRRLVLLLLAAGCRQVFGLESPTHAAASDAAGSDAIADAGPCVAASQQCLGDQLRTCTAAGASPVDTPCGWGCVATPDAHCGRLMPSGGAVASQDLEPDPQLSDVTLSGMTVLIDSDTGAIGVPAAPEMFRAAGTGVSNGIDFEIRGNVGVFRFKSLAITGPTGGTGARAVALVADGTITLGSSITARGSCGLNVGTLGGYAGGANGAAGDGPGGGGAGTTTRGGGGGGGGSVGGLGGNDTPGGAATGDDEISVLVGGGGGGGGANARGAIGGGAIQLASNTSIAITGSINAGGCGGADVTNAGTAGGGGAGGAILLEAPAIQIGGTLAVNGGGGGASGIAGFAQAGRTNRLQATGDTGTTTGGGGGYANVLSGGNGSVAAGDAAGGGGAVGRIRFDTRLGGLDTTGAVLSPALTDSPTTCTQGVANVQ